MPKVVHFEIPVDDPDRAVAFYRDAFHWEIAQHGPVDYWLASTGPREEPGADGALTRRTPDQPSTVVVVGVDSVDDFLDRVRQAGGDVVAGRQPVPGVGWSATSGIRRATWVGLFEEDPSAGA